MAAAVELFGLPITEARKVSGLEVQYFYCTCLVFDPYRGYVEPNPLGMRELGQRVTSLNTAVERIPLDALR